MQLLEEFSIYGITTVPGGILLRAVGKAQEKILQFFYNAKTLIGSAKNPNAS